MANVLALGEGPMSLGPYLGSEPWVPNYMDTIWGHLVEQINPFTQVLAIPGPVYRACDDAAKAYVAMNFQAIINEPVMFCRDGVSEDRYYLGNPAHFAMYGVLFHVSDGFEPFWVSYRHTTMSQVPVEASPGPVPYPKTAKRGKEHKIPRPPNAYILYRKERHTEVKEAHPGITNNEISQVLGVAWNNESREVRQKYKDLSEQLKKKLFEEHPDYQYKPRKPSEKKRRTRRSGPAPALPSVASNADSGAEEQTSTP